MIITRAAIMFSNGEVVEGHTYSNALSMANKLGLSGDKIHGFVTSSGKFVLPSDATEIAKEAGQTSTNEPLQPEDIWPILGEE